MYIQGRQHECDRAMIARAGPQTGRLGKGEHGEGHDSEGQAYDYGGQDSIKQIDWFEHRYQLYWQRSASVYGSIKDNYQTETRSGRSKLEMTHSPRDLVLTWASSMSRILCESEELRRID